MVFKEINVPSGFLNINNHNINFLAMKNPFSYFLIYIIKIGGILSNIVENGGGDEYLDK